MDGEHVVTVSFLFDVGRVRIPATIIIHINTLDLIPCTNGEVLLHIIKLDGLLILCPWCLGITV